MSSNFSFFNESGLGPHFPTEDPNRCFFTSPVVIVLCTNNVIHILLLLPLCIFIVYFVTLQQKGDRRVTSHCDSFTYHLAIMELIGTLGCVLNFFGICMTSLTLFDLGLYLYVLPWYGQIFFHALTCVEHYMAVAHPIFYRSLKHEKWIHIRNIINGCIWLLCSLCIGVLTTININYLDIFFLTSFTIIASFCSLSALCVLIRPGPGERADVRGGVNQSKKRAVYTILMILGIAMLRLFSGLLWTGLEFSGNLNKCLMIAYDVWSILPSNLILPLLFVKRTTAFRCPKT